jgi:hypothetical protein
MAITYVGGQGAGFAGKTGTTTVTFALTGGLASVPAAGDLVVVAYHVGATSDLALTIRNASAVDYTLIGSELYQNDTYDSNLRVAYRFMPGTPETTLILSGTGSISNAGRYTIHVFRGVDPSSPLDVAAVTAGAIDTRVVNPGAITPSTAGAWIYVAGGAATATGGTYTAAYLSDFRAGTTSDTVDSQIGAGYYSGWTSGSYDPASFGGGGTSTTNDSWTSVTVALRPAVNLTGAGNIASAFAAGVAVIALALAGAGNIASSETFGTATVTPYSPPVELTDAGGISSGEAHGSQALSLTTAPAGIVSAEAHGTQTLSLFLIGAGAIPSSEAIGIPTVAGAPVELSNAGGIASSEAHGNQSIEVGLAASGIASGELHGTQILTLSIAPSGILSAEAFGLPSASASVETAGIDSEESIGSPTVQGEGGSIELTAVGSIGSAETFGYADVSLDVGAPEIVVLIVLGIADKKRSKQRL